MSSRSAERNTRIGLRHRTPRETPFSRYRLGRAVLAGAPRFAFPGISFPEPEGGSKRALALVLAGGLHLAVVAALLIAASLAPEIEEEVLLPVQLLRETPVPRNDPAPAPKALAERRDLPFAPAAQAVAPQVVNPTVVARAAPAVPAERLEIDSVASATAPRQVARTTTAIDTVKAVTTVTAAAPTQVDVADVAAPALRGPIEVTAPVGPSVGPRQIVAVGNTVGTGPASVTTDGSSVRDAGVSTRDVLGSPDGPRLANVNTRVGTSHLRGPGGTGTSLGGLAADCGERPEVQQYLELMKDRVLSRWSTAGHGGSAEATLRFQIDVGGSARNVALVDAPDQRMGSSVVEALRAASPFPPMGDRVKCLSHDQLVASFKLNP